MMTHIAETVYTNHVALFETSFSEARRKLSNGMFRLSMCVESFRIHGVYVDWFIGWN